MSYPNEFTTQPDEDGDSVRISERAVNRDLRFAASYDPAWVKRDDIPEMIEWLQDYYAATEPPPRVEPEPGTMLQFTDGSYGFRVSEGYEDAYDTSAQWRILYTDGSNGMFTWDYVKTAFTVKED